MNYAMNSSDEKKDVFDHNRIENDYYAQLFQNLENKRWHNPYNHEVRQSAAIRQGDMETLLHVQEEDYSDFNGVLSTDSLRQAIDIGIVGITVATRAAISAGVHFEKAFTLSDVCIQHMEASKDVERVNEILNAAEIQCCKMVYELKMNSLRASAEGSSVEIAVNPHIERCKDYIFRHLHGKINVAEMAEYVGLKANYLSTLFKKYEKMTIKQYVMNEKIHLIEKMLIYSPYNFIEIATYLGFSSQSHMGVEFKKATGMTPKQFRERFQKEDFFDE